MANIVKFQSDSKAVEKIPGRSLALIDIEAAHKAYEDVYFQTTGKAWKFETFEQRSKNWIFYGNSKTYITVRPQKSGGYKLVTVVGDPDNQVESTKILMAAFVKILKENKPLWGLVNIPIYKLIMKATANKYFSKLNGDLLSDLLEKKFMTAVTKEGKVVNYKYPAIIPDFAITAGSISVDAQNDKVIVSDIDIGDHGPKYFIVSDQWIDLTVKLIGEKILQMKKTFATNDIQDELEQKYLEFLLSVIDKLGTLSGKNYLPNLPRELNAPEQTAALIQETIDRVILPRKRLKEQMMERRRESIAPRKLKEYVSRIKDLGHDKQSFLEDNSTFMKDLKIELNEMRAFSAKDNKFLNNDYGKFLRLALMN
jgi:hypothetical protein